MTVAAAVKGDGLTEHSPHAGAGGWRAHFQLSVSSAPGVPVQPARGRAVHGALQGEEERPLVTRHLAVCWRPSGRIRNQNNVHCVIALSQWLYQHVRGRQAPLISIERHMLPAGCGVTWYERWRRARLGQINVSAASRRLAMKARRGERRAAMA